MIVEQGTGIKMENNLEQEFEIKDYTPANYNPETALSMWCDDLFDDEKREKAVQELKEFEYFAKPFFSNLDEPVYVAKGLPEEVIGALSSRLSRANQRLRRLFYEEYVKPILHPNIDAIKSKDDLTAEQKKEEITEARWMKKELRHVVNFLHEHNFENVANTNRARDFFKRWLSQYGDESIAQLEAVHIGVESVSNVLIKRFEDFRIGHAPLEKSTRYVYFDQKVEDMWQYYNDPEIIDSPLGEEYSEVLDSAFENYTSSIEPLSDYLQGKYKRSDFSDITNRAYREMLKAKACDILRCYLPMATQTTAAFLTIGQSAEYILNRFYPDKLGEIRWLAASLQQELDTIIPSLVERPKTERGREYQQYFRNTSDDLEILADRIFKDDEIQTSHSEIELVDFDPNGEDKVIAAILYPKNKKNLSLTQILEKVKQMDDDQKLEVLTTAVKNRNHRTHKTIRAFENADYTFHINGNVGVFRDIHRHRMLTQDRPLFSFESGYDTPQDLVDASLDQPYHHTMNKMKILYQKMKSWSPEHAQYVVPMGAKVSWYQKENLREAIWEIELRTGPQGHPDYRRIEQKKFELISQIHPLIAKAFMFVDMNDYELARRESEKRTDKKLAQTS